MSAATAARLHIDRSHAKGGKDEIVVQDLVCSSLLNALKRRSSASRYYPAEWVFFGGYKGRALWCVRVTGKLIQDTKVIL